MKKFRRFLLYSILFCLALIIAAWHQPTEEDFITFSALMLSTAVFFGLISKKIQKASFLLHQILFYVVVTAVMSIIIPVVDAAVMSVASFICELVDNYRNKSSEIASD